MDFATPRMGGRNGKIFNQVVTGEEESGAFGEVFSGCDTTFSTVFSEESVAKFS